MDEERTIKRERERERERGKGPQGEEDCWHFRTDVGSVEIVLG